MKNSELAPLIANADLNDKQDPPGSLLGVGALAYKIAWVDAGSRVIYYSDGLWLESTDGKKVAIDPKASRTAAFDFCPKPAIP